MHIPVGKNGYGMNFDVGNIPPVIQGTASRPGKYGRSAYAQYTGYQNAVQDHYIRTGDIGPLEQLNQSSIRYTPDGTIAKGAVSKASLKNALGYATADIRRFDENRDGALDKREMLKMFLSSAQPKLDQLERVLRSPAPQEERLEAFKYKDLIINYSAHQAANYISSIDVADPATGQRDGKITADEAAAKLLFDDSAKQMFEDNQVAYQTIIGGLKSKTDYDGPSFEQLQQKVQGMVGNAGPNSPFLMDGQLTAGERDIADALTAAPIATNQIVSQIHDTLKLKERLRLPLSYRAHIWWNKMRPGTQASAS
jgi:hypothetical protein